MTYQYDKKKGWYGFCDNCQNLYAPRVINASYNPKNRRKDDNDKKVHLKIDFSKSRKRFRGFCGACCDSKQDNGGSIILENIRIGLLISRKFGDVVVV